MMALFRAASSLTSISPHNNGAVPLIHTRLVRQTYYSSSLQISTNLQLLAQIEWCIQLTRPSMASIDSSSRSWLSEEATLSSGPLIFTWAAQVRALWSQIAQTLWRVCPCWSTKIQARFTLSMPHHLVWLTAQLSPMRLLIKTEITLPSSCLQPLIV